MKAADHRLEVLGQIWEAFGYPAPASDEEAEEVMLEIARDILANPQECARGLEEMVAASRRDRGACGICGAPLRLRWSYGEGWDPVAVLRCPQCE